MVRNCLIRLPPATRCISFCRLALPMPLLSGAATPMRSAPFTFLPALTSFPQKGVAARPLLWTSLPPWFRGHCALKTSALQFSSVSWALPPKKTPPFFFFPRGGPPPPPPRGGEKGKSSPQEEKHPRPPHPPP